MVPRLRTSSTIRSRTSIWCAISRNVVGSSSNRIRVFWASVIAIQARCRWPPERLSRGRSPSDDMPVSDSASSHAASSSCDQRPNNERCGYRPCSTSPRTVRPSGAVGPCESTPMCFATSFAGRRVIDLPSSRTDPSRAGSMPASERSKVDLPLPFGPRSAVKAWLGTARSIRSMILDRPYATVRPVARRPPPALSCSGIPPLPHQPGEERGAQQGDRRDRREAAPAR